MLFFNERTPLVRHNAFDLRKEKFIFLSFALIIIIILLTSFISSLFTHHREIPIDISDIPHQYTLRQKSHWSFGYLIEALPSDGNGLLAEIASTSPFWTQGYYEVDEYRQNFNLNEPLLVKTVDSRLGIWNTVYISFKKKSLSNDTLPTDLINPVTCDYKITWGWFYGGYIHRKCEDANETKYTQISRVTGSTGWGLVFYSNNDDIYASTSETQYWWHMNRRKVVVEDFAPFPPAIPAIYTAYYDLIQYNDRHENNDDINKRNKRKIYK